MSDAELRTAKKQVIAADTFEHDGIEQVAEKLARWQAWSGDWNNDARFAARIEAVTADQVRQAARRYLTRDNLTVGTFTASPRPSSGKVNALSLRGARVLGRSAYRRWADAATAWGAQNGGIGASDLPTRFTLPNGVVLVVGENHISASAVIEVDSAAGSEFDTPGSSGLAALTQDMLLHGTAAAPGEKWQDALDALGVNVDTWVHVADAGMSAQTLSADEPKAMALLADALQHSAFDADEFGLSKAQLIDDVRAGASDASNVAREALYRMLYPRSSPWAWPADGTVAGLEKVRRADALAFYRAHYAPNDTIIAVTGDVDPRAIQAQVVRLFGTWRRVRVAAGSGLAGPTLPAATRRANAVVPGTTQVDVWAGAPGVSARSDDYDAAQLMNFILGGGSLSSMMLHQAREVDGYVYNIGSRFSESTAGGGPWTMTFAADRADVDRVMAEAAEQMRSLQRAQLSEDELAQYRRLAADAVLTGELSNGGLADDLMEQELLGLGVDHSQQLRRIFDAVTPAQIQAAAQKYLEPDRLTISTAGPP
ncbi:MAG: insulinase family protein [Candidatus Eremiobacteraeota bacterium]|nr:insulinase family protein [Candidatus Eremiobacteraeota bacterium]